MEYFTSLSESQIVGIILPLAVSPFLFIAIRRWWWAKQSVHWPKTKGIVIDGIKFRLSRSLNFLYTYDVNGVSYKGDKPFFYNSYKTVKKVSHLIELYPDGKQVVVYYNPSNHKISTLEPGRKDGVNGALLLLLFLFSAGLMALSAPGLISEIIDYFLKLIL
ncbi:DUF3592 domain-containing protein [Cellulophaga sp. Hel_I_12]|uniref:DUF3592 domain-containing protein n=1 Tax=Cellulophaga sp. Hel_I_12 TaxID=1249972 RepID=UPI00064738CA|nr:DUF3592 domain-containing protein [Cellulophaga sp. Hel_I_12]